MKIGIISLGCAKNLVDTENLLGVLQAGGQEFTTAYQDAEAIIINTCGFISAAKEEALSTMEDVLALKGKKLKKIVVMGCLATRYKQELIENFPEIDRFISLSEYDHIGSILSEVLNVPIANVYGKAPRVLSGKPWMAYVRIADGCDNCCAYCAIPSIRGKFRSRSEESIEAECKALIASGVKEINLIAQDSSMYGIDLDGRQHLAHLLHILNRLDGIHWIRVLYLYPDEIPDDLIDAMRTCEHVLPYFDIPIQHGSDHMLTAMHRRGSRKLIMNRCAAIRKQIPKAILRTTLICGFPGESEEDHQLNLSLVKQLHWDHLGVFTYSHEEGTPGAALKDDVDTEMKEARKAEIIQTQMRLVQEDRKKMIGRTEEVLIEGRNNLTEMYTGRSAFYAPDGVDGMVMVKSDHMHKAGDMIFVRYVRVSGSNLIGEEIQKGKI